MRKIIPLCLIAFLVFSLTAAYGDDSVKETPITWEDGPAFGPNTKEGEFIDETKKENESISKSPNEITVFVDGRQVNFPDVKPYIKNGRTLVPIRFVSEEMGAKVSWNEKKREVLIEKNGKKVLLKIASKNVYVNGVKKIIDVPAELKNGRTMVPFRFISEAFGADVHWVEAEKKILISNVMEVYGTVVYSALESPHYELITDGGVYVLQGTLDFEQYENKKVRVVGTINNQPNIYMRGPILRVEKIEEI